MANNKKIKALVLLSGGLDSMLACEVLKDQGISVTGICFSSNFFNCERARKSAGQIGVPLIEEDISEKILELVKCPSCGYGKNMNPCIDCHSLMIKEAAKYLKTEIKNDPALVNPNTLAGMGKVEKSEAIFDFIATGEVLGQRPFSQNKEALEKVKKLAGIEVLRPLSAKLLPETEIEKKGLAKRERLLDIKGRSREAQMKLAEKYGIKDYPSPAGGCLLTDPEGAKKILDIVTHCPACKTDDVELLKNGRVFWFRSEQNNPSLKTPKVTLSLNKALKSLVGKNFKDIKVQADINFHWIMAIVGRNEKENNELEKLAKTGDIVIKLKELNGPTTLIRNMEGDWKIDNKELKLAIPEKLELKKLKLEEVKDEQDVLKTAGILTGYYATKARGEKVDVSFKIK
ncbi:MAG: tRNA 4-thiouridine(8) synthase ThiI [Patescibacteria group bacterium]|jgi:tRNA U34 2-thiouridine synthase MnmA/TrmU